MVAGIRGVHTGPGATEFDPDALLGQIRAQALGERDDPTLGGRVVKQVRGR